MQRRRGSLFVPNFKRTEIMDESQLTSVILYIHMNPILHGFTGKLGEWSWNSYAAFLTEKPTFLKRKEVLEWFGNREEFLKFHHARDQ
jgi:putative transposase